MCAIPGVDHLAHEDILPYTTSESNPLQHELFDKFLMYQEGKDPPFVAQDILRAWQEKNHPLLDMSDVHKETTENIRVTVIPFYMGYRQGLEHNHCILKVWANGIFFRENQQNTVYFWRYCIRLENLGEATVQLRERNWRIFSPSGTETVKGRGVVGQEPVLSRHQPAFQYSSYMSLQAPSGHMWLVLGIKYLDLECYKLLFSGDLLRWKGRMAMSLIVEYPNLILKASKKMHGIFTYDIVEVNYTNS